MTNYIKYDYKLEEIPENFDEYITEITSGAKEYIKNTPHLSQAKGHTRDAHATGFTALKAEVEIFDNLAPELAQGIYATPGKHDAVIRFSSGSARVLQDKTNGNAQGFAIKIFNVPGVKLAPGEELSSNVDLNLINHPIFFCNSADHYATFISDLFFKSTDYFAQGDSGAMEFAIQWLTKKKTALPDYETFKEYEAFQSFGQIPAMNSFLYEYYSQGAVRHGDYIAKVRVAPTEITKNSIRDKDIDTSTTDWAFRKGIIKEISENDMIFELQVQLCLDLKEMPINDLTKEWSQELSPFRTVGRITIPKQEVPEDGNFEIMENLSFTPFRIFEQNSPIGSLQRARQAAYLTSSVTRHELNGIRRREPENLKDAFDPSFYQII